MSKGEYEKALRESGYKNVSLYRQKGHKSQTKSLPQYHLI